MTRAKTGRGVIFVSIILTILLAIRPVPIDFQSYRPDWLLLVVAYWAIALPHRFNIAGAWVTGLTLDLLLGSTLGVQALAYSLVVYIAAINFQLIRNMSLWQQAIVIGLLDLIYRLVVYGVEHVTNDAQMRAGYFWPVLTTAIIWPWIFLLMRKIRRHFNVK